MVRPLKAPVRPLTGGAAPHIWAWRRPTIARPWQWCRVYHQAPHTPNGAAHRTYGPLHRFDPHTPDPSRPAVCPAGRSVLYVGEDLATSACEVFGETAEAALCPQFRVALLRPTGRIRVQDLLSPGAAMSIGALPALADADLPRALTQEWARAILEDQPSGRVHGVLYRSAYNAGRSLALWNCETTVETVIAGGGVQDFPLTSTPVYGQLLVSMRARGVDVKLISSDQCTRCR